MAFTLGLGAMLSSQTLARPGALSARRSTLGGQRSWSLHARSPWASPSRLP